MTAGFDRARLEEILRRGGAARRLEIRDEVGSTQDLAFLLAEHGAPDGSVAAADRQVRGRGRLGRAWESPAGAGLLASMVLRPPAAPPTSPMLLVAATAVAVAEAVERVAGVRALLRWPNDLLVGDRKLAGILVETRDFEPAAPLFVLGVGVNVAQEAADFPAEIRAEATSLRIESGRAPDRGDLLAAVIEGIDAWRGRLARGDGAAVEEAYRARAAYLGRPVTALEGSERRDGVLESVSPSAGVVLRGSDGARRTLRAEHVRDLRPAGSETSRVS